MIILWYPHRLKSNTSQRLPMKILLSIISTVIVLFSAFTSIILIKQYRATVWDAQTPAIALPSVQAHIPAYTPASAHLAMQLQQAMKPGSPDTYPENVAGLNVKKLMITASNQGLSPKALKSALNAYSWAKDHNKLGSNKDVLTVVDFTMPSSAKRMWVIDVHQNRVLMKLHTTQGSGSGLLYANHFSNTSRTQASSLGLYVTSEEYVGKHGKSMRLNGLQQGINSNARNRSIVIHEAAYASPQYIKANHRAGRSWGCFAVAPENKKVLLNYVRGGSAFFAYAKQIEKTPIISHGPLAV